tara:strand:+ start:312 stop:479 length:168 start_codon:yes stop_codon:yes gene_type:complete
MIQSVKKFEVNNVVVSYKMTLKNGEMWSVPIDENNRHYQEIQKWVEDGNTIEEAD